MTNLDPKINTGRPIRFGLQARLILLMLAISIPLIVGISYLVSSIASTVISNQTDNELVGDTQQVRATMTTWLNSHYQLLQVLSTMPEMVSMDQKQQKPILQKITVAYPDIFLAHAIGMDGMDTARSDNAQLTNYSDRTYFTQTKAGAPSAYELVIGKTNNKADLAIAAPIKDTYGNVVGVISVVSTLDVISSAISTTSSAASGGTVFVIDASNQVVAHPDPIYTSGTRLYDFSQNPPVVALRQGKSGLINYTDPGGKTWRANIYLLSNNWGIVSQAPLEQLLAPLRIVQQIAIFSTIFGVILIVFLAWIAIRRTIRPIAELTETASAVASGNLNTVAEVRGHDEVGLLARTFNDMTSQLRDLISNLEGRVADRTAQLELRSKELAGRSTELELANAQTQKRVAQLQAVSEVARAIASVRQLNELLPRIASVISDKFGYYHVGIFLLDDAKQFAILSASNSEGGKRMLDRGHRLRVGAQGIVGFVANTGESRIAVDTGLDAVYFDNPDLPETKSEMAVPLKTGTNIIGALDLQSTQANAFTSEDVEVLQTLADQVSIAIENARLFDQTQRSLADVEVFYRQYIQNGWQRIPVEQDLSGYRFSVTGAVPLDEQENSNGSGNEPVTKEVHVEEDQDKNETTLTVPIILRDEVIGVLNIRAPGKRSWTPEEIGLVQAVADRVAVSAENARLFDETTRRAEREKVVSDITTKIRSTNDPNEMVQIAISEIKQALNVKTARIIPYSVPKNGGKDE